MTSYDQLLHLRKSKSEERFTANSWPVDVPIDRIDYEGHIWSRRTATGIVCAFFGYDPYEHRGCVKVCLLQPGESLLRCERLLWFFVSDPDCVLNAEKAIRTAWEVLSEACALERRSRRGGCIRRI